MTQIPVLLFYSTMFETKSTINKSESEAIKAVASVLNTGVLDLDSLDKILPDVGGDPSLMSEIVRLSNEENIDFRMCSIKFSSLLSSNRGIDDFGKQGSTRKQSKTETGSFQNSELKLYAHDVAKYPLLQGREEKFCAKLIEYTRARFRQLLCESEFIVEKILDQLERVRDGSSPFHATLMVGSEESGLKESQIRGRLAPNITTIKALLGQNNENLELLKEERLESGAKQLLSTKIIQRRNKMFLLLQELGVRSKIYDSAFTKLEERFVNINQDKSLVLDSNSAVTKHSEIDLQSFVTEVKQRQSDYHRAKDILVVSNLRLVIAVAKKFQDRGLPIMDLIEVGNLGLLRAVEKYEYRRGYKFSTYATYWVNQGITRSLVEDSKVVSTPVHVEKSRAIYGRAVTKYMEQYNRTPALEELAEYAHMSLQEIKNIRALQVQTMSIDCPVRDSERLAGHSFEDQTSGFDKAFVSSGVRKELIEKALESLEPREAQIIKWRFGLINGIPLTLNAVGRELGVSRERVRQLEERALKKLSVPSIAASLEDLI